MHWYYNEMKNVQKITSPQSANTSTQLLLISFFYRFFIFLCLQDNNMILNIFSSF
ncbi:hypothetical protein PGB90_002592 [Kerria lacca]